ncbi:MAG: NrtA/SsuA/CpmA family ABC transporter substrate-binding protein [Synergistaceae bacterium]|nr:NrtA/SsuA/CpmA family ABC transporter substrate-binding protein [Synergistaceae bacterium]
MTKKMIFLLIFLLTLSLSAEARGREMRIALWKLPLNLPAIAAIENGTYEKAFEGEYKVEYINLPSGPKQVQAIAAGELDIAEGLGAAAVIVGIANGVDITIIGANSRSPEAFAVVVKNSKVRGISDLRGKKIAGLRGSVVHQLFVELLYKEGLTEKDVEFFPMPLSAAASALIAERVDAALLAGTEIVRAEKGGCRVLSDGKGIVEGLSLIVAKREFAEKNRAAIKKYLEIRERIRIEVVNSPRKIVPLLKKETGLTEKEIIKILPKFNYDAEISENDILELKKTAEYLIRENIIKFMPDINNMLWK